jgi:hypothetical protein
MDKVLKPIFRDVRSKRQSLTAFVQKGLKNSIPVELILKMN